MSGPWAQSGSRLQGTQGHRGQLLLPQRAPGSCVPRVKWQEGRREGRGPRVTPAAGPREGQSSTSHLLGQEEL